jgi:hypothetical protein
MISLLLEILGLIFLVILALWAAYEFVSLRRKRKHQRELWNATMNLPLELREIGLRHITESGMMNGFKIRKSEVERQVNRVKREKAQADEARATGSFDEAP